MSALTSSRRTAATRSVRRVAAAGIVVVGLAACGSDDGAGTDATSAATSTVATPPVPTSTVATPPVPTTQIPTTPAQETIPETIPETTGAAVDTTETPVAVGLVLRPDGLGENRFGDDRASVIDALTASIGTPISVPEPYQDSANTSRASAVWDGLAVTFTGPVDGPLAFSAYEFGRVHQVDASGSLTEGEPWAPAGWQAGTATDDGISPGVAVLTVAEGHPTVHVPDCGRPLQPSSLLGGAGTIGQTLFLEPVESGLYVRVATDGTIFSVGAQAAPNEFACDGA